MASSHHYSIFFRVPLNILVRTPAWDSMLYANVKSLHVIRHNLFPRVFGIHHFINHLHVMLVSVIASIIQ
jgi:hypothetical protein